MITLIKYRPAFGLPDPSPFCMKAELLLKMSGLPYRKEEVADPRRGPKGKLPAIVEDGVTIGDSEIIRWHLERKHAIDFDRGLGPVERARGHAYARMLEERTYWAGVYSRWIDDSNWPLVSGTLFASMPAPLRAIVPPIARAKVRKYLYGQGIGRHSPAEIYAMGAADMRALAAELGDKPFMMGEEPTGLDATAHAFVAAVLVPPLESPIKAEIQRHSNLVAYCGRMSARFFA